MDAWRALPAGPRGAPLILVAGLLVSLGTIGVLYEGNLVWVNRLEHPFILGCLAAGAFGVGVCQFITKKWLRILIGVLGWSVAVGWFFLGLMWFSLAGTWPIDRANAPTDAYGAVVVEGDDWIDTNWYVWIQQHRGLLSRQWLAGCFSNDYTADYTHVVWESPTLLAVFTHSERMEIRVDPQTGKPTSTFPPGYMSCRGLLN
jgi:hypothetical protein